MTAENQEHVDRVSRLMRTPAAVWFVSVEPMLGPVVLNAYLPHWCPRCQMWHTSQTCYQEPAQSVMGNRLSWVICGGETGPGARPIRPEWVRSLRDQCQAAGVPFWFKGWGGPHHEGWVIDGTLYQGDELDGRVWHERPEREER